MNKRQWMVWSMLSVVCFAVCAKVTASLVNKQDQLRVQAEEALVNVDQALAELKVSPTSENVDKYVLALEQKGLKGAAYAMSKNNWYAGPLVLVLVFSLVASIWLIIFFPMIVWMDRRPQPTGLA